ncbi:MAG: type IX secretion system membrane protein PorP/SprF [Bacteroidota bacterium]
MNQRILLPLLVFSVFFIDLKAQDPQFTQFYANPMYLNPAFTGTARCPRICMNYRNQWPNLSGTYVTYSASYDMHLDALAGGIGALVTTDDQAHGTLKTTNFSILYAYHAAVTREFSIKFGIQATYLQKSLDKTKLNFGDMIDARRGFVWNTQEAVPSQTKRNADFSTGILGYSKYYFFGFAAHHINQPDEGLLGTSKLPAKFTGHAGAIIPLEKGNASYLSPNILFQQQQKFSQLNLGLYYVKGAFVAGLWYRNADAVIALVGVQNANFKFGYSYDVTISKLSGNTAGSHEISLQIQFECKPKRKKYRTISCPSF